MWWPMPVIAATRMLREKNPGLSRGGTASQHGHTWLLIQFRTRLSHPAKNRAKEDFSWQFFNTVVTCAELSGELKGRGPHRGPCLWGEPEE